MRKWNGRWVDANGEAWIEFPPPTVGDDESPLARRFAATHRQEPLMVETGLMFQSAFQMLADPNNIEARVKTIANPLDYPTHSTCERIIKITSRLAPARLVEFEDTDLTGGFSVLTQYETPMKRPYLAFRRPDGSLRTVPAGQLCQWLMALMRYDDDTRKLVVEEDRFLSEITREVLG